MRRVILVMTGCLLLTSMMQGKRTIPVVDALCGRLVRLTTRGFAKDPFPQPLANREVRVYRRVEGSWPCCDKAELLTSGKSDKYGQLNIKLSDGEYWVVVTDESRELALELNVDHRAKSYCLPKCAPRTFAVTEERFELHAPDCRLPLS